MYEDVDYPVGTFWQILGGWLWVLVRPWTWS